MIFSKKIKKIIDNIIGLFYHFNRSTRRVLTCSVSFLLVLTVFVSVMSTLDLTYAVSVSVNGQNCGYVSSTRVADKAVDSLSKSLNTNDDYLKPSVGYSHAVVTSSQLISANELADNIIENGDICAKAVCIVVNDKPLARVESVDFALQQLALISGNNAFYNHIEIEECLLTEQALSKLLSFDQLLSLKIDTDVEYLVVDTDTTQSVAERFNISEDDVPQLVPGQRVNICASLSPLAVSTYVDIESRQAVSASLTRDKAGYDVTVIRESYVDGIKYSTEELNNGFVLRYPDKPTASRVVEAGKLGFCWPVDTGYTQYISSFWGDDRGHQGYDIAAKTGTPILSVKSGKVVSVNSNGSAYGQHFVIDHGNGIKTLYAHCSKLYVSVGDKVERGEVVALVGATGRVTGTHLHFEVYKNGARVDPMSYIGSR